MKLLSGNVIAVGGGKGGVGKSFFASNIACALAKNGQRVILVDADLAGANIHILFGIKYPEPTLGDYIKKKVNAFTDVLLPTMLPNLQLVCGASDLLEIANPHYAQKQKIISDISRLNADFIVIDIGAGASLNNLDFFNTADTGILVTTPSPTSLQNAYGFLKLAVQRKVLGLFPGDAPVKSELSAAFRNSDTYKCMKQIIDRVGEIDPERAAQVSALLQESRYWLVVNMASLIEEQRVAKALGGVAYQYLNVALAPLGSIAYDRDVENSIRKMEPLLLLDNSVVMSAFMHMAEKLREESTAAGKGLDEPPVKLQSSSRVQLCLHDEVLFQGTKLHVQTEDLGMGKAHIVSLVFSGGRILYSRKSPYDDILRRSDVQHVVAERVKEQHLRMLDDIKDNVLASELSQGKGP
jgi:flagellar biosynthesis protein FlhG